MLIPSDMNGGFMKIDYSSFLAKLIVNKGYGHIRFLVETQSEGESLARHALRYLAIETEQSGAARRGDEEKRRRQT